MCRLHFAEGRLQWFLQLHRGNTDCKQEARTKKRRLQAVDPSATSSTGSQGTPLYSTDVLHVELQRLAADRATLVATIKVYLVHPLHPILSLASLQADKAQACG